MSFSWSKSFSRNDSVLVDTDPLTGILYSWRRFSDEAVVKPYGSNGKVLRNKKAIFKRGNSKTVDRHSPVSTLHFRLTRTSLVGHEEHQRLGFQYTLSWYQRRANGQSHQRLDVLIYAITVLSDLEDPTSEVLVFRPNEIPDISARNPVLAGPVHPGLNNV